MGCLLRRVGWSPRRGWHRPAVGGHRPPGSAQPACRGRLYPGPGAHGEVLSCVAASTPGSREVSWAGPAHLAACPPGCPAEWPEWPAASGVPRPRPGLCAVPGPGRVGSPGRRPRTGCLRLALCDLLGIPRKFPLLAWAGRAEVRIPAIPRGFRHSRSRGTRPPLPLTCLGSPRALPRMDSPSRPQRSPHGPGRGSGAPRRGCS